MEALDNKIFKLYKLGNPKIENWGDTKKIDSGALLEIKDHENNNLSAKVATSIPTPFARIYLFDTAFQFINEEGQSHNGNTVYHRLVSDCLDIFEMLFYMGSSDDFTFIEWDKETQINNLLTSEYQKHKTLGEAFNIFFQSFQSLRNIFLIYYKGVLLGGTSPLTIFFTSPNWQREMKENGWKLSSARNNILFSEIPTPLHTRDSLFQEFMHKFYMAYRTTLVKVSTNFNNYLSQSSKSPYSQELSQKENTDWRNFDEIAFISEFEKINISKNNSGTVLYCGDIPLLRQKPLNITNLIKDKSDFVIQPTVSYYKEYKDDTDGEIKELPPPLALVQGFNQPFKYIEANWDKTTEVEDLSYKQLQNRILPKSGGKKYPFVTIGDFFESTLLKTEIILNNEKFITGYKGDFEYLLPIKKEYFNFFTKEDLKKNLTIIRSDSHLTATLKIPVRRGFIDFTKVYNIKSDSSTVRFNIGIFPFYKVIDQFELNDYEIIMLDGFSTEVFDLKLFQIPKINNSGNGEKCLKLNMTVRQTKKGVNEGSIHYRTDNNDNSFDIIEFNVNSVKGLIMPVFKELEVNRHSDEFFFGIDFGTSNTYIAYNSKNVFKDVISFDITENDMQLVLLNQKDKNINNFSGMYEKGNWGGLPEMEKLLKRESIPSIIGFGKEPTIEFPFRTAICESNFVEREINIFGNINIAFFIDYEIAKEPNSYHTNIKWGYEENKLDINKNRVLAFFKQLLWMIKNKILLNNGIMQPKISYYLPISMKSTTQEEFHNLWGDAVKDVFGKQNQVTIKSSTESVVPYYELKNNRNLQLYVSQDMLNIDIGGGTTDVLFFVNSRTPKEYYSTSFRFAANDIWGDAGKKTKKNGFLQMMENQISNGTKKVKDELKEQFDNNLNNQFYSSADIINFLFKFDNDFSFTSLLKNNRYLKNILFLHYSSIIYHIAQMLDYLNIDVPMYITFTGKGSEYINLISRTKITDITRLLLSKFTNKKIDNKFEVILVENPKQITAKGGVHMFHDKEGGINPKDIILFGFAGNEQFPKGVGFNNDTKDFTYGDIKQDFIDNVVKNILNFLEIFYTDPDISKMLKKDFEVHTEKDNFSVLEFLKQNVELSIKEVLNAVHPSDKGVNIEETLFFWTLKESLYRLSIELFNISK